MYRYFISYQANSSDGSWYFGHVESETNFKITGIKDIRSIAESIEDDKNFERGSVIILNYKVFDDE